DRDAEDAVVEQRGEIRQADEMAGNADAGVGDGQPNALDERIGDEQAEQNNGRQQQRRGEPALVLEEPGGGAALRRGDEGAWGDDVAYGHRRLLCGLGPCTASRPSGREEFWRGEPCRIITRRDRRVRTIRCRSSPPRRSPTSPHLRPACPGPLWRTCR